MPKNAIVDAVFVFCSCSAGLVPVVPEWWSVSLSVQAHGSQGSQLKDGGFQSIQSTTDHLRWFASPYAQHRCLWLLGRWDRMSWDVVGWWGGIQRNSLVMAQSKYIPWRIHGAGICNLTWLGYSDGIRVTIYSSTMDPMGIVDLPIDSMVIFQFVFCMFTRGCPVTEKYGGVSQ